MTSATTTATDRRVKLRRLTPAEMARLIALHAVGLTNWEIVGQMADVFPDYRKGIAGVSSRLKRLGLRSNRRGFSPACHRNMQARKEAWAAAHRRVAESYGLPGDLPAGAVAVALALAGGPLIDRQLWAAVPVNRKTGLDGFRKLEARGLAARHRVHRDTRLYLLTAAGMDALAGKGGGS